MILVFGLITFIACLGMMASTMDLTSTVFCKVSGTGSKSTDLDGTTKHDFSLSRNTSLADGTAADQADLVYFDDGELAAAADVDLDLAGTLSDVFGDTVTFARIKVIMVSNVSDEEQSPATDAILSVGGGTGQDGTNAFDTWITSTAANGSERVFVRAGGTLLLFAPDATAYAVTAGTIDILNILNTDGADAGDYSIALIGVST